VNTIRNLFFDLLGFIALLIAMALVGPILHVVGVIPPGQRWTGIGGIAEVACTCALSVFFGWVITRSDKRSAAEKVRMLAFVMVGVIAGGLVLRWNDRAALWQWTEAAAIIFPSICAGAWIAGRRK
jgi:type VI protein secretion system component VasK